MTNLWLPDGKSLLKLVREGDVDAWYRLDLESGEFRKLAAHGKNSDEYFFASSINALSPDGRRLYFGASKPTNPGFIGRLDRIGSLDLVSGERQILFMLPGTDDTLPFFTQGLEIAISPNGQTFAVTHYGKIPNSTHLARVDITGQNYRELTVPFKNDQLGNKLTWSRDGRSIFFVMRTDGDKDRVMRVSADGGQPEFTGVEVDGLNDFDLSPDGERIASGTVRPEGTGMLHWTLDVASLLRLRR
jgi:Tol biopolymer transport system component